MTLAFVGLSFVMDVYRGLGGDQMLPATGREHVGVRPSTSSGLECLVSDSLCSPQTESVMPVVGP